MDINGSVSGGNISGNATGTGPGVNISGNNTLTDTNVSGNATTGNGVDINGNLTNNGNTTIGGSASGNGSGVDINGSVSGGNISGNASGNGNGVNISGNVTDGNISGNAVNGNGVEYTGPSKLTNTTVSGSSVNGMGVKEYSQGAVQQMSQQNQAALRALRSEGSDALERSGYRAEQQTQTITVCDEDNNCTRSTVSSAVSDAQPPHRHTGVAATPLSSGSAKNR